MASGIKEPFLERGENQMTTLFQISADELSQFFEQSNIDSKWSIDKLRAIGKIEGLCDKLCVRPEIGIESNRPDALKERADRFGTNETITKDPKTYMELIIEQFEDFILKVLIVAAVVSLVLGILTEGWDDGWYEGVAILVAVGIILNVTAMNNWLKERQFQKLNQKKDEKSLDVIRGGKVEHLDKHLLLVGDIVKFIQGDAIPVDGVLLRGEDLLFDESQMTGESDNITKMVPRTFEKEEKANPFILSGSKCLQGSGVMITCAVGARSLQGKNQAKLSGDDDEKTPLQDKLELLANKIGLIGTWAAALTAIACSAHMVYEILTHTGSFVVFDWGQMFATLVDILSVAVTIIVVAVPEGLPLAVTIALAYSVNKMKDEQNLVRVMAACEIMGAANNICSDKTGTLTQNVMSVESLFIEDNLIDSNVKSQLTGTCTLSKATTEFFCEGICANSSANPKLDGPKVEQRGNKTECAVLELAYHLGFNFSQVRVDERIKKAFPFNSSKKCMTTVFQSEQKPGYLRVYVKGGPDIMLKKCSQYIGLLGEIKEMDEEFKARVIGTIVKGMSKKKLRTLGFAYKEIPAGQFTEKTTDADLEKDLIFIGIAGIKDPVRPDVPQAVADCQMAQITVRMVTGDIRDTAIAIAKDCNILPANYEYTERSYEVMEGYEFRTAIGWKAHEEVIGNKRTQKYEIENQDEFKRIAAQLKVLARSSPEDKFALVLGLKKEGNVVAVTGDGTNDAPALKKADVGFAMNIAGTDVAKFASDIIILDDNFKSIVTAIRWGRNVYDGVRKFIQFQLSVNIVAMFMAFLGGVLIKESPLTAIQLLWVNLIMDTFASLALATELPAHDVLQRAPISRKDSLITPFMWKNIILQSIYQIIVLTVILFMGPQLFSVPSSMGLGKSEWNYENGIHYTIVFNTFVFMQVFNEFNARKLRREDVNIFEGICSSCLFIFVIVLTLVIQFLFINFGGRPVRCAPLTLSQFVICICIGAVSLIIGLVSKILPDSLFSCVHLLDVSEEEAENHGDLNKTTPSLLRKKSSIRMRNPSGMSHRQKE